MCVNDMVRRCGAIKSGYDGRFFCFLCLRMRGWVCLCVLIKGFVHYPMKYNTRWVTQIEDDYLQYNELCKVQWSHELMVRMQTNRLITLSRNDHISFPLNILVRGSVHACTAGEQLQQLQEGGFHDEWPTFLQALRNGHNFTTPHHTPIVSTNSIK